MMELRHPDEIFAHGASPSMVTLWLLCKHKWWLHYVAQQGRQVRESQKDSGVAFHNFFEAYYDPALRYALTLDDHIDLFKQDFPEEEGDEKRDQQHCLAILKAYTKTYPVSSEPFDVLETEQAIQVAVPGCILPLNVKLDMAIEWRNGLWAMDHKTANRVGLSWFDQFENHWQTYLYPYALGEKLGRNCEGILYNAISMKKQIDPQSFLRKDFPSMATQVEHKLLKWTQIVNDMYEFVYKNWTKPENFAPSTAPFACKSYNVKCPFTDYCKFNQNERMLP